MERLTKRVDGIVVLESWAIDKDQVSIIQRLCNLLSAYEDSGLEPDEIADFMKRWEQAVEIGGMLKKYGIDHIWDIIQAEQAGRLVVLPCKVGDDVWFVRKFGKERCIKRAEVSCINIDCRGEVFVSARRISGGYIGKTVFLTREEAEAALKGGEEHRENRPD